MYDYFSMGKVLVQASTNESRKLTKNFPTEIE